MADDPQYTYSTLNSYLDRSAFANAYVSGLKESLNLEGNQYSNLLAMFTAGSCVGQIPHALIIQKVAPGFWLPFTLLVWSGLTMCSAACKTYVQLCTVRFFQGFFESSLYSGTIYILGSWYKPLEIAKRTAIFTAIGQIGSMFAGVMMTAMNEGLHEQTSLQGWQWVFIISMCHLFAIQISADEFKMGPWVFLSASLA
jgi:ACS family pantothenate transporter-like MFS transporter